MGAASSFALFTAVGAFGNSGATSVTGDIGTNSGAFNSSGITLIGNEYLPGSPEASAAAAAVIAAYTDLFGRTCGTTLTTPLGNDQILTSGVYCITTAATLTGDLTLSGGGVFIIQIGGAFATDASSRVLLANGASLCNVYWQIGGQFDLGASSVFRGTAIVDGAVNLLTGSSLLGRGLSKAGAISLNNNIVTICTSSPLPIELISFSAKKQDNDVLLNWATASELNNDRMELQKSFNASDFETIATLKGSGTTNEKSVYSFLDKTPFEKTGTPALNIIYYRLKQIDFDGAFENSRIISIVDETTGKVVLYPNPASDLIIIMNISNFQDFSVTDILGRTVINGQYDPGNSLDISKLQTGCYFLNIQALKIKFLKN